MKYSYIRESIYSLHTHRLFLFFLEKKKIFEEEEAEEDEEE